MFCKKCGNQIDDNIKFCNSCGASINNISSNNGGLLNMRKKKKINSLINEENRILENNNKQPDNLYNNESNINVIEEVNIIKNNETVDFSTVKKNRNFIIYLILTFLTGGLYMVYFWWGFIKDMNLICGEEGESPNAILVLIFSAVTFGLYYFYWVYKHSERIKNTAARYNVVIKQSSGFILLCTLTSVFTAGAGVFLGQYFMITNFNKLTNTIKGE